MTLVTDLPLVENRDREPFQTVPADIEVRAYVDLVNAHRSAVILWDPIWRLSVTIVLTDLTPENIAEAVEALDGARASCLLGSPGVSVALH